MIVELTTKGGVVVRDDCSAMVNFYHSNDHLGNPQGVVVSLESDTQGLLTTPLMRVILTFSETRLLAHRLLRTIGDRA